MNHIKKAEIVFPEISDRKIHVKRKVTVETGKQSPPKTEWQLFCETFTFIGFVVIAHVVLAFIIIACGGKP